MANLIKKAEKFCLKNNNRITLPRMEVLKIIDSSKCPIKAYEILTILGTTINNPKPPTVYRAIDFWLNNNFIHRIDSLNAYMTCKADHRHEGFQYMICDDCGKVIESHLCQLPKAVINSLKNKKFIPAKWNLEINGSCEDCR